MFTSSFSLKLYLESCSIPFFNLDSTRNTLWKVLKANYLLIGKSNRLFLLSSLAFLQPVTSFHLNIVILDHCLVSFAISSFFTWQLNIGVSQESQDFSLDWLSLGCAFCDPLHISWGSFMRITRIPMSKRDKMHVTYVILIFLVASIQKIKETLTYFNSE